MLIIGLTGSIGMGKSTAAARLRHNNIAVCDSDRLVHDLYEGEAVPVIEAAFPDTISKNDSGRRFVDRKKLAAALLKEPSGFTRLEEIVHPLVRAGQKRFLQQEFNNGSELAVLEIPLLFETGADKLVDTVVVVSAPADIQRDRVLQRPGMSAGKLNSLLARQLPDKEKRARADFIVDTSGSIEQSNAQIDRLVGELSNAVGTAYDIYWASSEPQ